MIETRVRLVSPCEEGASYGFMELREVRLFMREIAEAPDGAEVSVGVDTWRGRGVTILSVKYHEGEVFDDA